MRLFRRKKKENEPICIHSWHLIDTSRVWSYNGIDADFIDYYEIGCIKCNKRKELNEFDYSHFKRTFNVKEVSSHE